MAANCPQQVASVAELSEPMDRVHKREGLGATLLDKLGQVFCGIYGHDNMMQFEDDRMFLRCVTCGHESPGWDVPHRRPAIKIGESSRARTVRIAAPRRVA